MKPLVMTPELEAYMVSLLPPRHPVLARLEREAEAEHLPIVGPNEGALLQLLVRLSGARRILELGTATGYSGIWLLMGSPLGSLTTFETDPGRAARARANFAEAGLAGAATVVEREAVAGLGDLEGEFDLCFIDLLNSFASEAATESAYQGCLARLRPGGVLVADNALREGDVVRPETRQARNVAHYNRLVAAGDGLEGLVIPVRDGLSVARLAG